MYRAQMPRIYELRDLIADPTSRDAYFQDFDEKLESLHVREIYLRRERELQAVDPGSWEFLKNEASPYLIRKDPSGRGWQQLFDILNQARAYNYLKSIGCSNIQFIPRAEKLALRTPDLEAKLGAERILCEVKTINISQEEVRARTQLTVRSIALRLTDGFFRKLRSDVLDAKNQIEAYDSTGTAVRFIYINPCFDDFLAQCKDAYFQQIDQYLSNDPISGIDLIFHNDHTAFYTPLHMENAKVVNEE